MSDQNDLYRRDQTDGISPPNLGDRSTYAEHVVHARGKRTRYTSVSEDPARIHDFGQQLWKLRQPEVQGAGHLVVVHTALLARLQADLRGGDPDLRELAARAIPRVRRRLEALVDWRFDITRIDQKEIVNWVIAQVRPFFTRG